ncbi:MAG TPA: M55 family metallopeptidase [candidate division Zixibacteria bacterium]|nr:M55 family metallopeptidase [candidate division Zixibacteria bacterium]
MKAFISVDLEGLPFVVIPGHVNLKGSLYQEAREIATKITNIVVSELEKNNIEKIIIADSHGPMVNLLVDDLPESVEIIRGTPRPISMVSGVEECDIAIFLGYHAKFGTEKATFDHTYSGSSIHQVKVNDIPASEFILNAFVAGEYKVPVILIAGDEALLNGDVTDLTPWVEKVTLKKALSQFSARSDSMVKIEKDLREGVKRALAKYNKKEVKPLITQKPVKMEITFRTSLFADVADLLPSIRRLDGLRVAYEANNIIEAYKIFQFLVMAASGANALMGYLG